VFEYYLVYNPEFQMRFNFDGLQNIDIDYDGRMATFFVKLDITPWQQFHN